MDWSDDTAPARQALSGALFRIERRLRLTRALHDAVLLAGLVLLVLLAWRVLRWLGGTAPAASALVVLLAILAGLALLFVLVRRWLAESRGSLRAASAADARAGLKDELVSACWFAQAPQRSAWIGAQLERAAHSAGRLQPAQLFPLRLPGLATGVVVAAALALAWLWAAPPLAPSVRLAQGAAVLDKADREQVAALRELVTALGDSEAARKLEQALDTLQRTGATRTEQQLALEQAKHAVEQIRLDAAATRESLQRLSDALRGQGLEEVAQALARGDAKAAAELLASIQAQNAASASGKQGSAPEPADGSAIDSSLEQLLHQATESAGGAQSTGSTAAAMTVERLKEIAAQLEAAGFVNEAWQQVRGPQLDVAQSSGLTASRFGEQAPITSTPSPAAGDTPMAGGAMFRAAAVGLGDGRTEQEGGSRAGDAAGDAPPDALLGTSGERLEAQLKRQGMAGEEQEGDPEQESWFYAQSKEQSALVGWSRVQPRARFAAAEASGNDGISIQHRQIVKDYFMDLRKGER